MNRNDEKELFLRYIVDVYLKNPNLSVSSDIIYRELSRFTVCDNRHIIIDYDSLVGVQVALNNKFKNSSANTFTARGGYFWAIENRCGKNDKEFYSDMADSIKLYVSVDSDNIFKVSESLFNFMISENIVMQCKVAKGMRNDALVCRVIGGEAATKVIEYVNNLNYQSEYKPNPFLLNNGKVSVAMDGALSYNTILSKLLCQYFCIMRSKNSLDKVNCSDFSNFVKEQMSMLNGEQKNLFMEQYNILDENKGKDFIMICDLISRDLDGSLSLNNIFNYRIGNNNEIGSEMNNYSRQDVDKILYVINALSNYYSVEDIHNIVMKYIQSGNDKYFTRKDDIRYIVSNNFPPEYFKSIISNLGWRAFIDALKSTYDKYGEAQMFAAIKDIFSSGSFNKITNDYGVRSRLSLIIPYELLREVIINKLEEKNMSISNISLATLVLEEFGKMDLNKETIKR